MSRSAAAYQKFTEDEIRKANSVDILSLARGYGYEPEKAGRKAVHMKHSGGLYIFPENNRFFQWTGPDDGVKGGAIDFVMREEGSVPRRMVSAYFGRYGLIPKIKWSCSNLHTVIQAVAAGQGVSLLYSVLVQKEIDAGQLVEIPLPELGEERDIALAMHRNKARGKVLEQFIGYCMDYQ